MPNTLLTCSFSQWLLFFLICSLLFPHSSVGEESASNAGDPGLIPGSGRSPGEVIGYPLQYSWASLVAQLVKNPPTMRETWVQSLCWEDPLEKGMATHSGILAWRIPCTVQSMGSPRVGHNWATFTFTFKVHSWQGWGQVNMNSAVTSHFLAVWPSISVIPGLLPHLENGDSVFSPRDCKSQVRF